MMFAQYFQDNILQHEEHWQIAHQPFVITPSSLLWQVWAVPGGTQARHVEPAMTGVTR